MDLVELLQVTNNFLYSCDLPFSHITGFSCQSFGENGHPLHF